jgi:4,4'-diaponeurosporenoate glycosyltransferase
MRRPAAFGPCLLASADDYVTVGGHASVRGEVVEDVHLARRFHASGLPVSVFAGSGAIEFRMYPDGLRQLVEGWTKNIAAGARLAHPVSTTIAVWWVSACIGLTFLAARLALGAHDVRSLVAALGCWTAVTVESRWMWRRIGSFGWLAALLHPILTAAFVILFVRSVWLTMVRRRVRWSGRPIALASRRAS